jgi:hypothetical protein
MSLLQPWIDVAIHAKLDQAINSYPELATRTGALDIHVGKGRTVQVIAVRMHLVLYLCPVLKLC